MSRLLHIKALPEQARRGLEARAAARGQSLNAYLLDMIDRELARPTIAEVLYRAAQRAERSAAFAAEVVATARVERDELLISRLRAFVVDRALLMP